MRLNLPIVAGVALALLTVSAPLPMASAHVCVDGLLNPPCSPDCTGGPVGTLHIHLLASGIDACAGSAGESDPYAHCPHDSPHSHTYGSSGGARGRSRTLGNGESGSGSTTVYEFNTMDCNGDGLPWDFDGDYETGSGGAFFGHGPWADEIICGYGLRTHGDTVTVNDVVFGGNVAFIIGADDTSGPVIRVDPVTGETSCSTDGSITPGDPTADPNADEDDCLTEVYVGSGKTCGHGGDGGYWVFLVTTGVDEGAGGTGASNPVTAGTITA